MSLLYFSGCKMQNLPVISLEQIVIFNPSNFKNNDFFVRELMAAEQ
jgi:hypothetical protein